MAERYRWVQFPQQRLIPKSPPPLFRTQMPWWLRFGLVVIGLVLILVAVAALAPIGLLVWAAFTA